MSEKFRLDRKIGFQNTFCTKCINVIIDSIGPSIILRSIVGDGKVGQLTPAVFATGKSQMGPDVFAVWTGQTVCCEKIMLACSRYWAN